MNSDIKLDEIVLVVLEDFMVSARYVLWPLSCDLSGKGESYIVQHCLIGTCILATLILVM